MSNLKKVLALVLALALCLTMFAGAIETVLPFGDTDELTAEQLKALELTYALGVFKGDGENINPADTFTRAQLAAVLYRLYTADAEEKYVSTYTNVAEAFADCDDAWYTPYINWAFVKGVIAGYGDGNFGPNDAVTGVQAATMMARLLGYEVAGDNWELTARKIAIENGLDDGIASKDLFGTELTVGDMIVMVANTLNAKAVGAKATMAEEIFDLEIVEGAILLGADKLGSTPYSVFAFKDEIAGNVKYFIADLLSIEEKPTTDEIGQKYTLYVAKTEEVNGYKVLYAAYEEAENAYYNVVTGTVNDKALNVTDDTKADYLGKKLDKFCVVYVDGVAGYTFADFAAAYGVKNYATYKLIDNDGDGLYEYIFIERATFAALGVTEIVANVVSYNKGAYTLSNGETYIFGQYYDVNAKGVITGLVNAADAGVGLIGEKGHTASSVQYKFYVVGDYIMKVEVCDDTYFAGDYVLSMGLADMDSYKGMPYVEFLNENNELFKAYVANVDHKAAKQYDWMGNDLYYVVSNADGVVELFTAEYVNTHAMYNEIDKDDIDNKVDYLYDLFSFEIVPAEKPVYTAIDMTNAKYDAKTVYYIERGVDKDGDPAYIPMIFAGELDFAAQIKTHQSTTLYTITAAAKPAVKITVSLKVAYDYDEFQLFKAYGTWYAQNYGDLNANDVEVIFTLGDKTGKVELTDDKYFWVSEDGAYTTGTQVAADVKAAIDSAVAALTDNSTNYGKEEAFWSAAQALNTFKGVVFAYGKYPASNLYQWRAYNFDEFNTDTFGYGLWNDDHRGYEDDDQMIIANSNGQVYVKAMKVTVAQNDTLPMGWRIENSDTFIIGNDGVEMFDINGRNVQAIYPNGVVKYVYIPYGIEFIPGDIVYATKDEAGNFVTFELIGHMNFVFDGAVKDGYEKAFEDALSLDIDKAGVVTVYGRTGITYTKALDLTKTFFVGCSKNAAGEYVDNYCVDAETFASQFDAIQADDTVSAELQIYIAANGYTFVKVVIAD